MGRTFQWLDHIQEQILELPITEEQKDAAMVFTELLECETAQAPLVSFSSLDLYLSDLGSTDPVERVSDLGAEPWQVQKHRAAQHHRGPVCPELKALRLPATDVCESGPVQRVPAQPGGECQVCSAILVRDRG